MLRLGLRFVRLLLLGTWTYEELVAMETGNLGGWFSVRLVTWVTCTK